MDGVPCVVGPCRVTKLTEFTPDDQKPGEHRTYYGAHVPYMGGTLKLKLSSDHYGQCVEGGMHKFGGVLVDTPKGVRLDVAQVAVADSGAVVAGEESARPRRAA